MCKFFQNNTRIFQIDTLNFQLKKILAETKKSNKIFWAGNSLIFSFRTTLIKSLFVNSRIYSECEHEIFGNKIENSFV
jgi:hypothetical protein